MVSNLNRDMVRALAECIRRWEDVQAEPRPPKWQTWAVEEWEFRRECGARFSGPGWFGRDGILSERDRVRLLRAVYALHDLGLVRCTKEGPRLTHVRPTDEGLAVAAEFTKGAARG